MKDIQRLERYKQMLKLIEAVLEQQNNIIKGLVYNSKKGSLNKFNMSLNQYRNIIALESSRLQKKLDKLYDR